MDLQKKKIFYLRKKNKLEKILGKSVEFKKNSCAKCF